MLPAAKSSLRSSLVFRSPRLVRHVASQTTSNAKAEGDISAVFPSLSGVEIKPLPDRFTDVKRKLIDGNEKRLTGSWQRLLKQLATENEIVKERGPEIIPEIEFEDFMQPCSDFIGEVKKRGVAVIKGVVPEHEARGYKDEIEDYIKKNPSTKAFPSDNPQIFELYWSQPQMKARLHPNVILTQTSLMKLWTSKDKDALISTSSPLTYADRLRIRQPGDNQFALGPHVDGGSVERWEPNGYGLGGVYNKIFQGRWEEYNPFESSARIPAVTDLYQGPGGCSMFRMFQGWLGLSHTRPREGTLLVNPLLQLTTAYFLLRPFFDPVQSRDAFTSKNFSQYLSFENWKLKTAQEMDSALHGANPGSSQEFNDVLHPHLDLKTSMVHVPTIKPGDFVVWHCDTIHAVDQVHTGKTDSSVMYIPVCPVTDLNAKYLVQQREAFETGKPAPDFPGGKGESDHIGRATTESVFCDANETSLSTMGLSRLRTSETDELPGAQKVIERSNQLLGFMRGVKQLA
ncbi:related to DUF1479 domain protein [Rhynchosporium agropyri]|uniref:Related to DUF1479 domain protein n=1 Tax=Rhynchosporium agropyri TaxID=914238 RepID=A0A1E1K951_9HELO|nr:related to DUF1479 domain protein [Rhynchosporium agropyri]